jgi:hypothetical protein
VTSGDRDRAQSLNRDRDLRRDFDCVQFSNRSLRLQDQNPDG